MGNVLYDWFMKTFEPKTTSYVATVGGGRLRNFEIYVTGVWSGKTY